MTLYFRQKDWVEAEQWFPGKAVEAHGQIFLSDRWWFILSTGAAVALSPGDWLVNDLAGPFGYFVCSDNDFRASFEPMEEDDPEEQRF